MPTPIGRLCKKLGMHFRNGEFEYGSMNPVSRSTLIGFGRSNKGWILLILFCFLYHPVLSKKDGRNEKSKWHYIAKFRESAGAVILPILLAQAEVPPLLRNIQWLDMTDGDVDKAARTIFDRIQYHRVIQSENDEGTRIVGKTISKTKIVDVF